MKYIIERYANDNDNDNGANSVNFVKHIWDTSERQINSIDYVSSNRKL